MRVGVGMYVRLDVCGMALAKTVTRGTPHARVDRCLAVLRTAAHKGAAHLAHQNVLCRKLACLGPV